MLEFPKRVVVILVLLFRVGDTGTTTLVGNMKEFAEDRRLDSPLSPVVMAVIIDDNKKFFSWKFVSC